MVRGSAHHDAAAAGRTRWDDWCWYDWVECGIGNWIEVAGGLGVGDWDRMPGDRDVGDDGARVVDVVGDWTGFDDFGPGMLNVR